MSTRLQSVAACALAVLASGCVPQHFFVEEGHTHTDFHDIKARDPVTPVRVDVDFRRNGQPYPLANPTLAREVNQVLRRSHVLWPVADAPAVLKVVLDNRYDEAQARSSGFMTGFTEGFVGTNVKDEYVFTLTYKDASGQPRSGRYVHAIETVEGNSKAVSKARPLDSPSEAFTVVVKQSVLDFLADLQAVGDSDEPIMFTTPEKLDQQ